MSPLASCRISASKVASVAAFAVAPVGPARIGGFSVHGLEPRERQETWNRRAVQPDRHWG
jgi:hypothetical protein